MPIILGLFSLHRVRVLVLLQCKGVASVLRGTSLSADSGDNSQEQEREKEKETQNFFHREMLM